MEYWLIGKMLRENLDVYVPLVDDFGIDAVIRKAGNSFIEVQIKARSHDVKLGSAALFAAIRHPEPRENYYFVFHSERLESTWILSSEELIAESHQIKNGLNKASAPYGSTERRLTRRLLSGRNTRSLVTINISTPNLTGFGPLEPSPFRRSRP
jgi:hypothetical protein